MRALSALAAAILAGCGALPHDVPREYVSPDRYRLYRCDDFERESARIDSRASEIESTLTKFAEEDPPRNGFDLWPELSRLRGEHAALQSAAAKRQCARVQKLAPQRILPAAHIKP